MAAGPSATHRGVLLAVVVCLLAASVTPVAAQSDEQPGFWSRVLDSTPLGISSVDRDTTGFWGQTVDGVKTTWSGRHDLYIPGYIWHTPWKYSTERRERYNTLAWGLGYGRTKIDDAGRPRSLFAIVSKDSFDRFQYQAGYAWRARWQPGGGPLRLGAGYTALVIGRSDKLHYAPLPLALPLFSIGIKHLELLGAYVPGFEVGYFFLRVGAN
jgi:palmitoyl transferase